MIKGKIIVISGPSGVGKGTIIEGVKRNDNLNLFAAKSYTTRPERESDKKESRYFFVNVNKFKEIEKNGEIIESNYYNGNWYGSSKSEIEKGLNQGKNIIKDIDVNGGVFFKNAFPDAILIFVKTDLDKIKNRLVHRNQNTYFEIEERLNIAQNEMAFEKEYHHSVYNPEGHPEIAIDEIVKIIQSKVEY